VQGSITVRGTNRKDVLVIAHPAEDRASRRIDADASGLRRLPQTAGFRISEEANRVKVSSDSHNRLISFEIEAPLRTNLKLNAVNGGEIVVENIEGDLDLGNVNGGIDEQRRRLGECRDDERARARHLDARHRRSPDGVHVTERQR
jgi:hypothetical protein